MVFRRKNLEINTIFETKNNENFVEYENKKKTKQDSIRKKALKMRNNIFCLHNEKY